MPKLKNKSGQRCIINLTGKRFGKVIVLNQVQQHANDKHTRWKFQCDCGVVGDKTSNNFKKNVYCGKCYPQARDLTGKKFGRLTVIAFSHKSKGSLHWKCICDCGNFKNVRSNLLKNGSISSCGCALTKLLPGKAAINSAIKGYIGGAKTRDLEWKLSNSEIMALFRSNCTYCKAPPSLVVKHKNGNFTRNGIDRIDSKKGYFMGNVQPCCPTCNRAKGTLTHDEFLLYLRRIMLNGIIKTFHLLRLVDKTGTSGTGVVAIGAILPSNRVILEWTSSEKTETIFESIEQVIRLHGHQGATVLVWGDPPCPDDKVVKKIKKK